MSKVKKKVELQFFKTADLSDLPEFPKKIKIKVIKIGDLRSNGKTIVNHNAITMTKKYPEKSVVDEILNSFISKYLETNFYQEIRERLIPEQAFIRVHVPAISSKYCQDFYVEQETLKKLIDLKLNLDFWFI